MMIHYDISRRGKRSKYSYLTALLREDIVSGRLAYGARLPSRRALAEQLEISTATVDAAYRQLTDEGYLDARERSGFYVNNLPFPCPPRPQTADIVLAHDPVSDMESQQSGFEYSVMTKLMREVISKYDRKLLEKTPHNGCAALRNAISLYLYRFRGMTAQPANIVIGAGTEYLYGMIVQLLGRDLLYGVENPGYKKIRAVYTANGAHCVLLPLDENGVRVDALSETKADVLHVTPFHSFPTGITAPASRRIEYLEWASKRNHLIIEDDFDAEFAVRGMPPETLYSMDNGEKVIYCNTFSKSLTPSIRVGYMILPDHLLTLYREKLGFYACTVPAFDQYLLAEYISQGFFERHLNRARRRLRENSD